MPRPKSTATKQPQTEKKTLTKQAKEKPPSPQQQQVQPLTGSELIQKVKDLESLSKEEKARACGYITVKKNGLERINTMQFLNALLQAEGIDLDNKQTASGHGGRTVSYRISVQTTGTLLIGSVYTKQLGLNPGDEFEITLGRKHIRLKQLGALEGDAVAETE